MKLKVYTLSLILLFNLALTKVLVSESTTLTIISNVPARAFIDGKDYGVVQEGQIVIENLPLGEHLLVLVAQGYDTFASTFELYNKLELKIDLGKLTLVTPENVAKSNLTIRSEVNGGKVFIDGYDYNGIENGEKRIVDLDAGKHRLTIIIEGYEPYIAEITLPAGESIFTFNFD